MANGNGLGPYNDGPMTGRGLGNCGSETKDRSGNIEETVGKGFGPGNYGMGLRNRGLNANQGRGMGRRGGRRQFFRQTSSVNDLMDNE